MVSIYVQPTSFTIDKYPAPDKERAQLLWVAHMNGLNMAVWYSPREYARCPKTAV